MSAHAAPRVLLVDDHEGLLHAWRRLLSPSHVVVGAVTTGREALSAAAELNPDVVILDYFVADSNGIDLCSKIRAVAPNARVILVSANDDEELVAAARRAGAFAFVSKSATALDLETAIQRAFIGEGRSAREIVAPPPIDGGPTE
jgi:DNA-binding NarL/FixJ family response regulator